MNFSAESFRNSFQNYKKNMSQTILSPQYSKSLRALRVRRLFMGLIQFAIKGIVFELHKGEYARAN